MNVKDRYKAKQEAKEEAYYKGMEAPQTKMADTGNGFTQVQTNTDKNEPVNAPVQNNKQTTLQNYKPVEQAQPKEAQAEAQPKEQPAQQAQPNEEVPEAQVPTEEATAPEAQAEAGTESEPDANITGQVGEVDEGMMDQVGINPKNTEQENQKNTENIINKITGNRNEDGTYKPLSKWEYADGIQQFGILATIASIGLAVLTRGAFPPVDFSMFTGLNESYTNYVKGIDNYNEYIRQAQSENAYESERAKGSIDDANKTAQLNAAGEDHRKEVDANWQKFIDDNRTLNANESAKLNNTLQIALNKELTANQIELLKANTDAQKAIMELMYYQDIHKLSDTARAILEGKFTADELNKIAKFTKSMEGMTYFENFLKGLGAATNVVNAGANLVNSTKPGINVNNNNNTGSDAGTKEFFKRMIKF